MGLVWHWTSLVVAVAYGRSANPIPDAYYQAAKELDQASRWESLSALH